MPRPDSGTKTVTMGTGPDSAHPRPTLVTSISRLHFKQVVWTTAVLFSPSVLKAPSSTQTGARASEVRVFLLPARGYIADGLSRQTSTHPHLAPVTHARTVYPHLCSIHVLFPAEPRRILSLFSPRAPHQHRLRPAPEPRNRTAELEALTE